MSLGIEIMDNDPDCLLEIPRGIKSLQIGHYDNLTWRRTNRQYRKWSSISLQDIKGIDTIEELRLNCIGLTDVRDLSQMSNLRSLEIGVLRNEELDLTVLSGCTRLETLSITGAITKSFQWTQEGSPCQRFMDLSPLNTCTSLKDLAIGCQLEDIILLSNATVERIDLSHNRLHTELENIINHRIRTIRRLPSGMLDVEQMEHGEPEYTLSSKYKKLEHPLSLEHLIGCVNLRKLTLRKNNIRAIDLSPLSVLFKESKVEPTVDLLENPIRHICIEGLKSIGKPELGARRIYGLDRRIRIGRNEELGLFSVTRDGRPLETLEEPFDIDQHVRMLDGEGLK